MNVRAFAIALVASVASACANTEPGTLEIQSINSVSVATHSQQAEWPSPSHYDFAFERSCFCKPEFTRRMRVVVKDDAVTAAFYHDTQEAVPEDVFQSLFTINDLLGQIELAEKSEAADVRITYDAELGYPHTVYIDFNRLLADNEKRYVISDLNILKQ